MKIKINAYFTNQFINTIGNLILSVLLIHIYGFEIFGKLAIYFLFYFYFEIFFNQGFLTNSIKMLIINKIKIGLVHSINFLFILFLTILGASAIYVYYFFIFNEDNLFIFLSILLTFYFNLSISTLTIIYLNLNKETNFLLLTNVLRFLITFSLLYTSYIFFELNDYYFFYVYYSMVSVILFSILSYKLNVCLIFKNLKINFLNHFRSSKKTMLIELFSRIQNPISIILLGVYGSETWISLLRLSNQFTRLIDFPNKVFEKYAMTYFYKSSKDKYFNLIQIKILNYTNIFLFLMSVIIILFIYYFASENFLFDKKLLIIFVIPLLLLSTINTFEQNKRNYNYYTENFKNLIFIIMIGVLNVFVLFYSISFYGPIMMPFVLILFSLLRILFNFNFKIGK